MWDTNGNSSRGRFWTVSGVIVVLMVGFVLWSRMPPPQMAADEQTFNTVDALFTALTSKDTRRLEDCKKRLKIHHAEGKISSSAAARLDAIIAQAHEGNWEPSARTLYQFMLGQRGR